MPTTGTPLDPNLMTCAQIAAELPQLEDQEVALTAAAKDADGIEAYTRLLHDQAVTNQQDAHMALMANQQRQCLLQSRKADLGCQ